VAALIFSKTTWGCSDSVLVQGHELEPVVWAVFISCKGLAKQPQSVGQRGEDAGEIDRVESTGSRIENLDVESRGPSVSKTPNSWWTKHSAHLRNYGKWRVCTSKVRKDSCRRDRFIVQAANFVVFCMRFPCTLAPGKRPSGSARTA